MTIHIHIRTKDKRIKSQKFNDILGTGTLKYRVAKRGGGMWEAGTKIKILRSVGSGLFQIELPDGDMERVGRSSIDNYESKDAGGVDYLDAEQLMDEYGPTILARLNKGETVKVKNGVLRKSGRGFTRSDR